MSGQTIAQRLHDEILNGDLAPGTRLRQEEIAERFGSSRLPVRDALRRLEADGLVTIVSNSGAWVSKLKGTIGPKRSTFSQRRKIPSSDTRKQTES